MTSVGGHNKFETCYDCPHREPGCHDHCEGYQYRKLKHEEEKKKIHAAKYKQGIEYVAWLKSRNS